MVLCVNTNGILLSDRLDEVVACGVQTLTVTLNTLNPQKVPLIYGKTAGLEAELRLPQMRHCCHCRADACGMLC